MKYLLIELYNGKSRYINEDALKEWVGNSNPGMTLTPSVKE